MNYESKIVNIAKEHNGYFSTSLLIQCNIPRIYLTRLVQKNIIDRVSKGMYTIRDGFYDEYYLFQQRFSKCIYSYRSALYFHELTDCVPYEKEITLYKGYNPHTVPKDVKIHFVTKKLSSLGLTISETQYGNPIRMYDMERTICDLVKDRKRIDVEIFKKAINIYMKREDKNLTNLYSYAQKLGIEEQINNIVEILYK